MKANILAINLKYPVITNIITTAINKPNIPGDYIFTVVPSDGLPSGVALNDIAAFENNTWFLSKTYKDAPPAISVGLTTQLQYCKDGNGSWKNLNIISNDNVANNANIATSKSQQTLIAPVKAQPANNQTLDTIVNSLTGLINTNATTPIVTIGNKPAGGVIGTAAATVDFGCIFRVNQATAGQTLTLPNPTNATLTQIVTIKNSGGSSFVMYGITLVPGSSANYLWDSSVGVWSYIGISTGQASVVTTDLYFFKYQNGSLTITYAVNGQIPEHDYYLTLPSNSFITFSNSNLIITY